jgi:hypothetical protein
MRGLLMIVSSCERCSSVTVVDNDEVVLLIMLGYYWCRSTWIFVDIDEKRYTASQALMSNLVVDIV